MEKRKLTKREEYIKKILSSSLSDEKAEEITLLVSDLGDKLGFIGNEISKNQTKSEKRKHKYDVWIAKEVKKDLDIIEKFDEIRLIIDWVINTKTDLFRYDFSEALKEQQLWHDRKIKEYDIRDIKIPNIDNDRIIFRTSDKKHFFYLLSEKDLDYEGKIMKHCVSGKHYKNRIKNFQSLIVSLRDEKNTPHITIEIDVASSRIMQQYGKANSSPKKEYREKLKEFALFASGYEGIEKKEMLKFLNETYI